MLVKTAADGVMAMRAVIIVTALFALSGCGGGGSDDASATTACQRTDINSRVFCALQQDYLWYSELPADINPGAYSSPAAMLNAVAAPQDRYSFILTRQE